MRALGVIGILAGLIVSSGAHAAFVSYSLNQSNLNPTLPDGVGYARVTIDDNTANTIMFTVTPLGPLTSLAGQNFGIQDFGFNVTGVNPLADASSSNAQWTLPSGWSANVAPPPNQLNGFGRFDVGVSTTGPTRLAPLVFQLIGTGLGISSFEKLSTDGATEGNAFFSAHIAGFTTVAGDTGGFFGGSVPSAVPLPAAGMLFPAGLALLGFARRRGARL